MGFPVRVMEISDKKRFPTTVWTDLRAARAAERGEAIPAISRLMQEPIVSPGCSNVLDQLRCERQVPYVELWSGPLDHVPSQVTLLQATTPALPPVKWPVLEHAALAQQAPSVPRTGASNYDHIDPPLHSALRQTTKPPPTTVAWETEAISSKPRIDVS